MMFLLRLAFWIMLICLIIPNSRDDGQRMLSSAGKAVEDVRGFCGRNPDVCRDAQTATTSLLVKVKNGMEVMETWLTEKNSETPKPERKPGSNEAAPAPRPEPVQIAPQWGSSTLKASDKQDVWRGPDSKL